MASSIFWNSTVCRANSPCPLFRTICQQSRLAWTLAKRLKGMHHCLANFCSHSFFLRRCMDLDLVPTGLTLGRKPTSIREERWKKESERQLVSLKRKEAASRCAQLREGISQVKSRLVLLIRPDLLARLYGACDDNYRSVFAAAQEAKARKFNALVCARPWVFSAPPGHRLPRPPPPRSPPTPPPLFLNLSQRELSPEETAVLNLGSKFGRAGTRTPLAQLAARTELAAQSLANRGHVEDSERFRGAAINLVGSLPAQSQPNLTAAQQAGLTSLKKDKSRFVLRADKSETLVVLDKVDYEAKLTSMMGTGDYERLRADPYPGAAKEFRKILEKVYVKSHPVQAAPAGGTQGTQDGERLPGPQARLKLENPARLQEYKRVLKTHGASSAVHCLPKIHKLGAPPITEDERRAYVSALKLRVIAPSYASVDRPLCQHLTRVLYSLPRPAHSLRNLEDGVSAIQRFSPTPSTILISLDIEQMYPSIGIGKSCKVIQSQLERHSDLADYTTLNPTEIATLLEFCLKHTYLQTGPDQWWCQLRGLAMGKSISSAVAERYMIHLEERVKAESPLQPSLYLRWVDDTLAAWDHGADSLHGTFLPFLNKMDPELRWTVEIEEKGRLSFLDITIQRKETHLETSVHRKASNIRHFVPANSHHPRSHKLSAIQHGFRRAYKYCSTASLLREEISQLYTMFMMNGYSYLTIADVQSKIRTQFRLAALPRPPTANQDQAPHEFPIKIGLPYQGPWNRKIEVLGRKFGVFFASSNKATIRRSFGSPKVPQDAALLGGSVYVLECRCPDGALSLYCGQTGGRLCDRASQHKGDWNNGRGAFSAHRHDQGHTVDFDGISVIDEEENSSVRIVLEAFHIAKLGSTGHRLIANENFANRDARRINKSDGIRLSPLWQPVIAKLRQA